MSILKRKIARMPITALFNAILLLYLVIRATLYVMSQPFSTLSDSFVSLLLSNYPSGGLLAMLVLALAVLLWGAHLLQIFWNRFIADIFKTRDVSFQEALAIILIIAILR